MYAATTGLPERVAEFRWSADAGVTLQVFDEGWGRLARRYYENGVPDQINNRTVASTDGKAFLAALTRVRAGSYCSFVPE